MRTFLLAILSISYFSISAQQQLSEESQLLMTQNIIKGIFSDADLNYQNFPFHPEAYLHRSFYDSDTLQALPEIIKESFEIKKIDQQLANFTSRKSLNVKYNLPAAKDLPRSSKSGAVVKVTLSAPSLTDKHGNTLDLVMSSHNSGFTREIIVDDKDPSKTTYSRLEASTDFEFVNQVEDLSSIKGSTTVDFKVVNGVYKSEFNHENISDTISLGSDRYVIVDIFQNKIVLEALKQTDIQTSIELKVLNLSTDRKNLLIGKNKRELDLSDPMNFKDIYQRNFHQVYTLPKELYHYCKSNPEFSFDDFKGKFSYEYLKKQRRVGETYLVFVLSAPVNDIILYKKRIDPICSIEAQL